MLPLFRSEAIEGQRQQWLGPIALIRPLSFSVLTGLVLAVAAVVAVYFCLGHYTHKARLNGYLVPDQGVARLVAPHSATVLERRVRQGQVVRQGDVLFVLSLERATPTGDTQQTIQTSLGERERSLRLALSQKVQLEQTQLQGLAQQQLNMRQELHQMGAEVRVQSERLALAQATLRRFESLRHENFVSEAQVQAKAEEVLGLRAQLQALERQQVAHQREITKLQAQQRELPLQTQAQQGELERELASLTQAAAENEALRRLVIRAPQSGTLTAVLTEPGQMVAANTALASLVPTGSLLQAHLFAPSSAIGFVRVHQPVLLRYQAYPYQKFGHHPGKVLDISRTPLSGTELADLPRPDANEPLYRITVELERQDVLAYGQARSLSPGMQLQADVLLDRRRLIEWIFEPVLSIAGRI